MFGFFSLLTLFASFAISFLLLRLLVPVLSRRLPDVPNLRSSHTYPTPRGGGVVFVVIATVSSVIALSRGEGFFCALIPLLSLPLAFVGLLDDRHNISASLRFAFQLVTSALILVFSPIVQRLFVSVGLGSLHFLVCFVFLMIFITGVINFTNFMDGLDGLVSGCMIVCIATISIGEAAYWPLLSLVGSLLGFLMWNWSPAKVFMGDVGSTFLGAVFAGLVLQSSSWTNAFGYFLVATPLLADAFFCVFRRLLAGQEVFQAHRLHLFQRLHQSGWSHSQVSLTYIMATVALALAMLVGSWPWVLGMFFVVILFGVWLDQSFAVPFKFASTSRA